MSRPPRTVETLLADLADHIEWPEQSDPDPELTRRLATPRPQPRRRWIPVTAALAIVVASLLLFSPQAREAVADVLGVAGIEIEFGPELDEPVGAGLDLGREVSLDEAIESVDFIVSMPEELGDPDGVYLSGRQVNMVWEGQDRLPDAGGTDVGLLYIQFASDSVGDRLVKGLGPETIVVPIGVAGSSGFWIEGAPHVISIEDPTGRRVEETIRFAGNVLMWESDGVTHRLETVLGLEEALRIAESVQALR